MPLRPCRLGDTAAARPASACSSRRSVGVFSLAPPDGWPARPAVDVFGPPFASAWPAESCLAGALASPPAEPVPAAFSSASISSGFRRSSAMALPSLLHDSNFAHDDFLDVGLGQHVVELALQFPLHELQLRIAQILDARHAHHFDHGLAQTGLVALARVTET